MRFSRPWSGSRNGFTLSEDIFGPHLHGTLNVIAKLQPKQSSHINDFTRN
jgi:hypothetical protein